MTSFGLYKATMALVELFCSRPTSLNLATKTENGKECYVTTSQIIEQIQALLTNENGKELHVNQEDYATLEDQLSIAVLIAIGKLRSMEGITRDHVHLFVGMAARARKNDRFNQALDILKSLKECPQGETSEQLFFIHGRVLSHLKRYEDAEEAYRMSLSILEREDNCDKLYLFSTLFYLGQSLQSQKNYVEAIEQFQASLRVHRDNNIEDFQAAKVYSRLGKSYLRLGDHNKAIRYTCKCLELDLANPDEASKDNALAKDYNHVGDLCIGRKKYDRAIKFYQRSLDLQTDNDYYISWLTCKLGYSYAQLGKDKEAMELLKKGLKLADLSDMKDEEPRYLHSVKNLFNCYKRLSKNVEAHTMLENIIGRDDAHEEIKQYARKHLINM